MSPPHFKNRLNILIRWYEVYTVIRRLMLTSVPVGLPHLSATTIYVISVSVLTLVFERECQPYCNPYISAFSYVLHWQILIVVLYLLLLDSEMASDADEIAIGTVLMVTNLLMMVRNHHSFYLLLQTTTPSPTLNPSPSATTYSNSNALLSTRSSFSSTLVFTKKMMKTSTHA